MATPLTLDTLRRFAVARSLFTPTTPPRAIDRLGFVQADPIRAPARAQELHSLMHPRTARNAWTAAKKKKAHSLLDFIRERGHVHPREIEEYFSHGKVTNAWGGSSSATTHLLDAMHYRGLLRAARRGNGIRLYEPREHTPIAADPAARHDALVDVVVRKYAAGRPLHHRRLATRCTPPAADRVRRLGWSPATWAWSFMSTRKVPPMRSSS